MCTNSISNEPSCCHCQTIPGWLHGPSSFSLANAQFFECPGLSLTMAPVLVEAGLAKQSLISVVNAKRTAGRPICVDPFFYPKAIRVTNPFCVRPRRCHPWHFTPVERFFSEPIGIGPVMAFPKVFRELHAPTKIQETGQAEPLRPNMGACLKTINTRDNGSSTTPYG